MMSSSFCGKATSATLRSTKVIVSSSKSKAITTTTIHTTLKLPSPTLDLSTTASTSASSEKKKPKDDGGGTLRQSTMDLKGAASLAAIKKGPGYRSSFSGMVTTIFGANGCVGRAVCNRFGKNGSQLILPYRGDHYPFMRLKVCGDLGQVLFTPFHLRDDESIRQSMKHSNVVVNLIGRDFATRNFSMEDVNITGPARLARIAKECGVERFIHISHVNAREKPKKVFLPDGSEFLRTKWLGEMAVLEAFPDATIFRATDVYGQSDQFLRHYFSIGRWGYGRSLPLWKKGEETVKAPLYFSDLASGIINSLADPSAKGQTFEAFGPERFLQSELMDWMCFKTWRDHYDYRYRRTDLRFSPWLFTKTFLLQNMPIGFDYLGRHSIDRLERSAMSDEVLGLPNLYDLGVTPSTVAEKMPHEMLMYRKYAHYFPETEEDDVHVEDPKPLSRVDERDLLTRSKSGVLQSLGLISG